MIAHFLLCAWCFVTPAEAQIIMHHGTWDGLKRAESKARKQLVFAVIAPELKSRFDQLVDQLIDYGDAKTQFDNDGNAAFVERSFLGIEKPSNKIEKARVVVKLLQRTVPPRRLDKSKIETHQTIDLVARYIDWRVEAIEDRCHVRKDNGIVCDRWEYDMNLSGELVGAAHSSGASFPDGKVAERNFKMDPRDPCVVRKWKRTFEIFLNLSKQIKS